MIAEVVRNGSVIVREMSSSGAGTLSARSEAALDEVRPMLVEHDEWTFEVQVHTDEAGDPERDRALSTARARARRGVADERRESEPRGSCRAATAARS